MSEKSANSDYPYFYKLSVYLKQNRQHRLIEHLKSLKSDRRCTKIVLKDDGLTQLLNLLNQKNIDILSIVLSILADVCYSAEARKAVQSTEIVAQTLKVLNTFEMKPLRCKTCRMIGNLCMSTCFAKRYYDNGVVELLIWFLNKDSNLATRTMALRAIRNIYHMCNDIRRDCMSKSIHNIIELFECSKEDQPSFRDGFLKAFNAFLSTRYHITVGKALCCSKNLLKYVKLNNKYALCCLYKICHIPECRPDLGKHGAIETLVELVSKSNTFSTQALTSLCLFSREAINRNRIKVSSGLELMLNFMKNRQYKKYHTILLNALSDFVLDADIAIMVRNGLMDIIITRLNLMNVVNRSIDCSEDKEENKNTIDTESKNLLTNPPEDIYKRAGLSYDYYREDWGIENGSTSGACSPSTSNKYKDIENNSEGRYSPVFNDDERIDNKDFRVPKDSLRWYRREVNCNLTLNFLYRLTNLRGPVHKLADPCIIDPLICCVKNSKNYQALNVLERIARNENYLLPLVKQGFILEAQEIYECELCIEHLRNVANKGGAIGEFTTLLLRGQDSHKYITAVSIPFLITSKYDLKRLLNDHRGLTLIFEVLSDRNHNLYDKAILSICRLASLLHMQPDAIEKNSPHQSTLPVFEQEDNVKISTVTFQLDDGSTIDACRKTLCRRSQYFMALLEGSFLESGKETVRLKSTSKEGLSTLLAALNETNFENTAIESLLDAVLLAEQYLMTDVYQLLVENTMSKLTYENYGKAWNWARNNNQCEMTSYCIKCFLTTHMTQTERNSAFCGFSNSENFPEFLQELQSIISNVLCQR